MEHKTSENVIEDLKSKNSSLKDYIESLSAIEYKALLISIRELESSFSLEKSIGFIDYIKSTNPIN